MHWFSGPLVRNKKASWQMNVKMPYIDDDFYGFESNVCPQNKSKHNSKSF